MQWRCPLIRLTKIPDNIKLPGFNKYEFWRKNALVIQDIERQLRPCPFCHTPVELSCFATDYYFPDFETREWQSHVNAVFSIRCKKHCVDFRRSYDFVFKDNDDFSNYTGPVELIKEWNEK